MTPDSTAADYPRTLLVTGASGAIGLEIATQAASRGTCVTVHASTIGSAHSAVGKIHRQVPAAELFAVSANFHHSGEIAEMLATVGEHYGTLDGLIHCAITGAPGVTGPFSETDPSAYGAHAARVLGSLQQLCFRALPYLAKQGGAIVTFTSDAARFAAPGQSLIGAANGGIISFVRNLAMEVARENVTVNCISPSFVENTPAFDKYAAGGRGDRARQRAGLGLPCPQDIAPLALFLCGRKTRKITGQVISVNGGLNA